MNTSTLIFIGIILVIAIIIAIERYYFNLKLKTKLSKLSGFLNGKINKGIFSSNFEGKHKGFKFEITDSPGTQHTPASLRIQFSYDNKITARIIQTNPIFSFMQEYGLIWRLIKTNNLDFDKKFIITSSDKTKTQAFFSLTAAQNIITQIFLRECDTSIILKNHFTEASIPYGNLEDDISTKKIIATLGHLTELSLLQSKNQ